MSNKSSAGTSQPQGNIGSPFQTISADLKHIVVIVQENRSFDQYFGWHPGVSGFYDPDPHGIFKQPWPNGPVDHLYPFEMDPVRSPGSIKHGWADLHDCWNNGKLDRFLRTHAEGEDPVPFAAMGYYEPAAIPYHTALATSFTLCDHYFSGVLSSTASNRLMLMSGTIDPDGVNGGPVVGDPDGEPEDHKTRYEWESYPEQLFHRDVDFAVYEEKPSDRPGGKKKWTMNVAAYFTAWAGMKHVKPRISRTAPGQFEADAKPKHANLPAVSWLIPPYCKSEHPDYCPLEGAHWLAGKIDAILGNPDRWADTAVIVTYDESGGCFDHVKPPVPPAHAPGEWITTGKYKGQSAGPGFRVPCILVSRWSAGGRIASQMFDHTSVLELLGSFTGVAPANISAYRKQTFANLLQAFDFRHPAMTAPTLPAAPSVTTEGNVLLPHFPQRFPPSG